MKGKEAGIILAVMLALIVPVALWRAYVASFLWGWFATPTFGVAVPSIWVLAGLTALIGLFWYRPSDKKYDSWPEALGAVISHGVIAPALTLGFGWVLASFGGLL